MPFTPADLEPAHRAMVCHHSQYEGDAVERLFPAMAHAWNGSISLVPAFPGAQTAGILP